MGITNKELAKLKELAETADGMTSDYWDSYRLGNPDTDDPEYEVADFNDSGCGHVCIATKEEIGAYIAAARPQTILAMIAEIERLEKEADWLAAELSKIPSKTWREMARMAVDQGAE